MNGKRVVLLIISIILTAGLVIAGVYVFRLREAMANPVSVFFGDEVVVPDGVEDEDSTSLIREVDLVRNGKSYVKKDNILNVVVLGRDATPAKERRVDGGNTDIMIVMAIDLDTGSVRAISIPRDTVAHIYHYYDTEDVINKEYFDKLNGAYGAGPRELDDIQIRNSVTCITEFLNTFGTFDMEISNYVELGLVGLSNLTDLVGGVEVTLANGIPNVGSAGQTLTLDGDRAMTFVRDRYHSGGDLGRVSNSQIYIKALARKLQNTIAVEKDTKTVIELAESLINDDLIRTDLNGEELAALVGVLANVNIDAVEMTTIATVEKDDIGGFKRYLEDFDYDYETFYASIGSSWSKLRINEGDEGDFGFFADYDDVEEVMLDIYYEEVVFE